MTQEEIFNALNPAWWVTSPSNNWQTEFVGTQINFTNPGGLACTYVSQAPIQTNGLNAGISAPEGDLSTFIADLMYQASIYLANVGKAVSIDGNTPLTSFYNGTT